MTLLNKILKKTLILFITSFFIFNCTYPALAANYGLDEATPPGINTTSDAKGTVASKVGDILAVILSFVGIIFFVLMITGGIIWMVSGGNDTKTKKAKELIIAAVVGLIIVFGAYAIVTYVAKII